MKDIFLIERWKNEVDVIGRDEFFNKGIGLEYFSWIK